METRFIVSMIVDSRSYQVYELVTAITLLIQTLTLTLSLVNQAIEWPLAALDLCAYIYNYTVELVSYRPYAPYGAG